MKMTSLPASGVCMFVLLVFVYRFKDYNVINNSLLQEIKKQNQELKRSMEMYQVKLSENRFFQYC